MTNTGDKYFDSEAFHKLLDSYETSINAGEPVFMDADDLVDIADYYQYTGEKDKAEEAISLALSLSPGSSSPLTYRIHEALFQQNDPQKAWELLEQMIDKESPDYIFDRAEILISEGNIEEAEEYLEENFRDLPSDEQQDFIVDAANIFMDWRLPEKVIQWVTRGNPNDPNVKNSTEFKEILAKAFVEMGKYEDGKRIFNELIDKDPFSKKYWNALASAQFMNEDYSGAIQSSEYAIALEPEDPEGFITKANGLLRLNNFEEALKYYQRYLELEPDDETARGYRSLEESTGYHNKRLVLFLGYLPGTGFCLCGKQRTRQSVGGFRSSRGYGVRPCTDSTHQRTYFSDCRKTG